MSHKLSLLCDFCDKPISKWPSQKKAHNFCSHDCRQLFRVQKANQARDAITKYPPSPRLPPEFNKNTPKLTDEQIELGKSLLALGNSERFVATQLGVSRSTVRIHCKPGYKQEYASLYKTKEYRSKYIRDPAKERVIRKRRRELLATLKPDEYKSYVKKLNDYNRDSIRKSYLKDHEGKYIFNQRLQKKLKESDQ